MTSCNIQIWFLVYYRISIYSKFLLCLGYAWAEDKEHCEEYGRMLQADPSKVSNRAKKRGLPQVLDDQLVKEKQCQRERMCKRV